MQRIGTGSKLLSLFLSVAIGSVMLQLPAKAEEICQVTDPTGTPLNVRDRPNGAIVNALRNGREIDILDFAYDEQNRMWVQVGGYYEGRYRIWGWVIREFISCYDR